MKYFILSCFLIFGFSCTNKEYSKRLKAFKSHYSVSADSIMFVTLDDCTSCLDFFKESAEEFARTGIVVIVTASSKKAKAFLDSRSTRVVFDKDQLAKKLQLIDNFPVVYIKNSSNEIDSLKVRIE